MTARTWETVSDACNRTSLTSNCYTARQKKHYVPHSQRVRRLFLTQHSSSDAPAAAPRCVRHRNRCHDQFRNLSACVRLLFTFVPQGWRLPAPASVNPVCGHVLREGTAHWTLARDKGRYLIKAPVRRSDHGSLTMSWWAGVGSASLGLREVKSRLELTELASGEPRSIG